MSKLTIDEVKASDNIGGIALPICKFIGGVKTWKTVNYVYLIYEKPILFSTLIMAQV